MAAPLSVDQIQEVAKKSRDEARRFLKTLLGWPEFDEEEEPQKAIRLDCLYDCLTFMSQRGLAWTQISTLLTLLQNLLADFRGMSLPDTVKLYHLKLQSLNEQVSEAAVKLFTEYFFSSFLRHFKLYQFVFTRDQELLRTVTEVEVQVPEEPLPFTAAKDLKVYEYEQKYDSLERQIEDKQKEHDAYVEVSQRTHKHMLKACLDPVDQLDTPLERQNVLELINSVANTHVSAAADDLKTEISFTMGGLDLMLEKTALARPSGLGPPPRYKTKTPIQNISGKRQVSSRETLKSQQTSSRPGKK